MISFFFAIKNEKPTMGLWQKWHIWSQDNFAWVTISPPGSVVDKGVLKESAEDKEDADTGPDVDGLCVRHRWQRVLDTCLRGGQGEDKCKEISKYT